MARRPRPGWPAVVVVALFVPLGIIVGALASAAPAPALTAVDLKGQWIGTYTGTGDLPQYLEMTINRIEQAKGRTKFAGFNAYADLDAATAVRIAGSVDERRRVAIQEMGEVCGPSEDNFFLGTFVGTLSADGMIVRARLYNGATAPGRTINTPATGDLFLVRIASPRAPALVEAEIARRARLAVNATDSLRQSYIEDPLGFARGEVANRTPLPECRFARRS